jgi:proliferating cell nuclear antigen
VSLTLNEETRKLDIEVAELSYTLALIDPDTVRKEPDIPDLDLPATAAFEGSEFGRAVTAADLVADHIRIRADDGAEEIVFEADGDTDDVEYALGADDLASADVPETVTSLFSLDYLNDMTRPMGSDIVVRLQIGSEMPVKFAYQAAEYVSVENMLAPRIQSGGDA